MRVLAVGLLLVLAAWNVMAQAVVPETQLVLLSSSPERELACFRLEPGAEFSLEFINSIYLAPVREIFVYTLAEGVIVVRVESPSAGVFEYYGLIPDEPETAHLHRSIKNMVIRSHSYDHHRLNIGGKSISFKGLVPDGAALKVIVRNNKHCGS